MRLKTLNGAPLREHLDFSDGALLDVKAHIGFGVTAWNGKLIEDQTALKWRDIGPRTLRLRTGWSQPYLPGSGLWGDDDNQTFIIPGVEDSSVLPEYDGTDPDNSLTFDGEMSVVDDYLQHSLILHDTLLSSQVVQDTAAENTVSSSSFLTASFNTSTSGLSSPVPIDSHVLALQVPLAMSTTPLGSLPSAQYLRSIYPQTPTPNLLCALMTTPERREVFVRKGSYKMDLWEIIVGDDTRPNFKVTFWLRPPRESNNERNHVQVQLLHTLERLRVGNIILLRNIAVTAFHDIVHGQSLNTAITRARTSVDILVGSGGISMAQVGGLPASVIEMFMKVRRWARAHVARDTDNQRKRNGSPSRIEKVAKRSFGSFVQDELPPDTMESDQTSCD